MTLRLHEYQRKAIKFALERGTTYMMIDLGLGKTAIALKVAEQLKKYGIPTLVFAPLRVCYSTWPDEIKEWTPKLTYTILHGSHKNYSVTKQRDIYLLNYEGLKWFFTKCATRKFPLKKYFIVFDESSMLKSPSTVRFKKLKKQTLSAMKDARINKTFS